MNRAAVQPRDHGLVILSDTTTELAGCVTYWNLATVRYSKLVSALRKLSNQISLPELPSQTILLRNAIVRACSVAPTEANESVFHRSKTRGASEEFMVVRQLGTELTRLLKVKLSIDEHGAKAPKLRPFPEAPDDDVVHTLTSSIPAFYKEELDLLHPSEFGNWLVDIVKGSALSGQALRNNGGIYFIPTSARSLWNDVVASIQSVEPGCTFYQLPTVRGEDAAYAVTSALAKSIEDAVTGVTGELTRGKLRARALQTRKELCLTLLNRVKLYEETLGVQLDDLVKKCEDLEVAVATASIATMGQE